jgi:hypothetical protein
MRISQLIPDRDALITPDYYLRKNKLVQFTDGRDISHQQQLARDVKNIIDEPNWEYAAIERIDPKTLAMQLIPFNLGKAVIDRDPAARPGAAARRRGHHLCQDTTSATPCPDRHGWCGWKVKSPPPASTRSSPAKPCPSSIERAGGLTPEAYLYGTEFAREETRRQQQLALDDAVKRLEAQLASEGSHLGRQPFSHRRPGRSPTASRPVRGPQGPAQPLKNLKANGRIALELPTTVAITTELPSLPLEDGDRVSVPAKPAFVFAVGAVSNNNALLWRSGRKMRDYLDVAGVDADADLGNSFIVRADGTVAHASRRGWFNDLESMELMPGDTLVVPEKGNRETFWTAFTRGLKDWSQILYQFGLTAAAIKTLRN